MGEYKYIDISYLIETSDGDAELMKEMINIFFDQIEEFTDGLTTLYSDKKYSELGKMAHKAKSSIAIMGMESLALELKRLENNAKDEIEVETYPGIIQKFVTEVEEAKKELSDFIEQL